MVERSDVLGLGIVAAFALRGLYALFGAGRGRGYGVRAELMVKRGDRFGQLRIAAHTLRGLFAGSGAGCGRSLNVISIGMVKRRNFLLFHNLAAVGADDVHRSGIYAVGLFNGLFFRRGVYAKNCYGTCADADAGGQIIGIDRLKQRHRNSVRSALGAVLDLKRDIAELSSRNGGVRAVRNHLAAVVLYVVAGSTAGSSTFDSSVFKNAVVKGHADSNGICFGSANADRYLNSIAGLSLHRLSTERQHGTQNKRKQYIYFFHGFPSYF